MGILPSVCVGINFSKKLSVYIVKQDAVFESSKMPTKNCKISIFIVVKLQFRVVIVLHSLSESYFFLLHFSVEFLCQSFGQYLMIIAKVKLDSLLTI